MHKYFASGATRPIEFRLNQLSNLEDGLRRFDDEIAKALQQDLGKCKTETLATELSVILHEIQSTRRNLRRWARRERVRTPLHLWPARSFIEREPLGEVLIIGTWNYPLQLTLAPLVGAIAAGCTATIKPSELAPATSALLKRLCEACFLPEYIRVVEGGPETTQELLKQKFDHIFFTGSTRVGQVIYETAAKTLTPVTLELGGKSPAIVCADADLKLAARRIVWGKFTNAGQTCVAPDYVYADAKIAEPLLAEFRTALQNQYGANPRQSPDYGRIISLHHLERLLRLAPPQVEHNRAELYFAPTLIPDAQWNASVMQEEIFGPLLPILKFKNLDEAFDEISRRPKPLAAYLFSDSPKTKERFISQISCGGMAINDTLVHLANGHLPFGGIGPSGIGAYHGRASFETFSHRKAVVVKSKFFDLPLRYAPFSESGRQRLSQILSLSRWMD